MTETAHRPRRSALYLPGANARALEKAKTLAADTLIFDLEDAVVPDAKSDARAAVADAVAGGGYGPSEVIVRINGLDTDWGLEDIKAAVAARPDSGYIVDSLGWVLYRLGRYEQAVEHMEKAVALMPVDPVVNDHLGDVYWAVGRYREAEFQWKRALSFIDPTDTGGEADPDRIRRKLEVGLDQVLVEEGALPLEVANDDG